MSVKTDLVLAKRRLDSRIGTHAAFTVLDEVNRDAKGIAALLVGRLKKLAKSSDHQIALQSIALLIELIGIKGTLALGFRLAADAGDTNGPGEGEAERADRKKRIEARYAKGRPPARSAEAVDPPASDEE